MKSATRSTVYVKAEQNLSVVFTNKRSHAKVTTVYFGLGSV